MQTATKLAIHRMCMSQEPWHYYRLTSFYVQAQGPKKERDYLFFLTAPLRHRRELLNYSMQTACACHRTPYRLTLFYVHAQGPMKEHCILPG